MAVRVFKCKEGSLQHQFLTSRAKIRIFGGGFGNGKTTALCVLAIQIATDYPGANILLARSTYVKLEGTLKKEFLKWLPSKAIAQRSEKHNRIVLTNGTTVNFMYVAQQGKSSEDGSTSSNLLSANFDFVGIDQVEDPEIMEKDYYDLLGRLRGNAAYSPLGDRDPSMPETGPRWMVLTANPKRNWVYHRLVYPLYTYKQTGIVLPELDHEVVDEQIKPVVELFEGSTYTNADNLPADFIKTLESTYKGQMRERFLLGKWEAYEGLVYPMFDPLTHVVHEEAVLQYKTNLTRKGVRLQWIEGYDHGIAVPSCYLLGFVDLDGNLLLVDGFYESGMTLETAAMNIKRIRSQWGCQSDHMILADPAIFRRTTGSVNRVGVSVAGLFNELGIYCVPGNNEKINGIVKVQSHLATTKTRPHVLDNTREGSHLYFSTRVKFVIKEIENYFWRTDPQSGERDDKPIDRNDHAMDTLRYMLTERPNFASTVVPHPDTPPAWMLWNERDTQKNVKGHRYG